MLVFICIWRMLAFLAVWVFVLFCFSIDFWNYFKRSFTVTPAATLFMFGRITCTHRETERAHFFLQKKRVIPLLPSFKWQRPFSIRRVERRHWMNCSLALYNSIDYVCVYWTSLFLLCIVGWLVGWIYLFWLIRCFPYSLSFTYTHKQSR